LDELLEKSRLAFCSRTSVQIFDATESIATAAATV
jgi:hypothetical protein